MKKRRKLIDLFVFCLNLPNLFDALKFIRGKRISTPSVSYENLIDTIGDRSVPQKL